MYQVTKFFVSYPLNENEVLVYSTLTTSIFVLEYKIYVDIFEKQNIEKYPEYIPELLEMGILYEVGEDENQKLQDIRQKLVEEERGMKSITIAPTMSCNARCYYCFENGSTKGNMSYEVAKQLVKFIDENCIERKLAISWFGGEPLLAVNIIDYITKKLTKRGIEISSTITSNGSLVNNEIIKKFKKWKVRRIQITVDCIGEEYNKIKNYQGELNKKAFDLVESNIDLLLKNKIRVHIRVNYNPKQTEIAERTLEYFYKKHHKNPLFYMYAAPLDLKEIEEELVDNKFLGFMKKLLDYGYEYNSYLNENDDNTDKLLNSFMIAPSPVSCYMSYKYRFAVDNNGDLYKCHRFLGRKQYSCGNIFKGVEENEIYKSFCTSNLVDKDCNNCRLLPICQGGCNANRILYNKKEACTPIKDFIEQLIYMYYKELSRKEEIDNEKD